MIYHSSVSALGLLHERDSVAIDYPVLQYPDRMRLLNLEKIPEITGHLQGIKGQYLILYSGVINIRKYGGCCVEFAR
ncbi:MAG: DUF2797 domain-containing protein [Gammaproteobacteria bacterium]|nr:DUF2797 domain-containing protein [Gammaproteobacteria bacterium]